LKKRRTTYEEFRFVDRHVGVRLRGREELGLSRARAAEVIGLVMQQIANYELGVDRISPGRL
jgi:hypothetical protein